jgi:hypothetical protein
MNAMQDWEEKAIPLPNECSRLYDYLGTVTAIGRGSISIQQPGRHPEQFVLSSWLAAGLPPADPTSLQRPTTPDSKAYTPLPPGGPAFWYRLKDVQLGDTVIIRFGRVDKVNICDAICIIRRPGGRVPPAPQEETSGMRHSEWANAWQDWEEQGTPLPNKYAQHRPSDLALPLPAVIIPRASR